MVNTIVILRGGRIRGYAPMEHEGFVGADQYAPVTRGAEPGRTAVRPYTPITGLFFQKGIIASARGKTVSQDRSLKSIGGYRHEI